jgi:serine protease Do
MTACRTRDFLPAQLWIRFLLLACFAGLVVPRTFADDVQRAQPFRVPPALEKAVPESVEELRDIQTQVRKVLARVLPCTVAVQVGRGQGSGVIISEDGYVLTAGHVVGQKDREAAIVLPDGKRLRGKTLGANRAIDSGLIKITDEGKWPFVEMGRSKDLKRGEWCITVGHPGGFKAGRSPVVRVGRVLDQNDTFIRTTCALVGGDSGGPLFDLNGKVIGIHSRIGNLITANIHVPVDTYRDTWERLARGDTWGGRIGSKNEEPAWLGVEFDSNTPDCRLLSIIPGSPAEKAGLQQNDVVIRFGKRKIETSDDLVNQVARRSPGDEVTLEVQRGEQSLSLRVVLGKREG